MPDMTKKPRPPGSQVSPNPAHKPKGKAVESTHGKLYRVRDRDPGDGNFTIWGEDLTHAEAMKLKDTVVAARKSKTARVEEMPETSPDAPVVLNPEAVGAPDQTPIVQLPGALVDTMVASGQVTVMPTPTPFNAPSTDPTLEAARQAAIKAAAPVAKAAQAKHDHKKIVMKDPPKPPPSPLTDELLADMPDGPAELPPEQELDAGDVQELVAEVGAGPGDEDKTRARQQADADVTDQLVMAKTSYEAVVAADKHPDTWPSWGELGPFEVAAWRYYATNGGAQPQLTRTMRQVGHAMRRDGEVAP